MSFFYFCTTLYVSNANSFEVHFAVAYPLGSAILFVAAYFGYKLSQKSEDCELLKKGIVFSRGKLCYTFDYQHNEEAYVQTEISLRSCHGQYIKEMYK